MAGQLKPLADRVVVKALSREETTKSGIVLPDTVKEKPQDGKVLAVGAGRLLENGARLAMEVKVGDTVVYSKYAGTEVKMGDEDVLVLRESDILAIANR
jgi:chaperonin GroES